MVSERLFEITLVLVVAVIVLAFGIAELKTFIRESREIALKTDLRNLRNAIAFHYANTNRYPATLDEAVSKGLGKNMTLIIYNVDDGGEARDPFGRRYFYNPQTGEVHSRTPGYQKY